MVPRKKNTPELGIKIMLERNLPISTTAFKSENIRADMSENPSFKPFGQDGISFLDFLDIINPLQHIPLVSTIYRKITGDTIDPASRIAGSALYGGPIGAVTSLLDVMIENSTGKDIVGHALKITSHEDENIKKITVVNKNQTKRDTTMILNYWPELPAEKAPHAGKNYSVTNSSWDSSFQSKRNANNLTMQSMLLKKIHAGINIEEQMKSKKEVHQNQVIGAYNSTSRLTK